MLTSSGASEGSGRGFARRCQASGRPARPQGPSWTSWLGNVYARVLIPRPRMGSAGSNSTPGTNCASREEAASLIAGDSVGGGHVSRCSWDGPTRRSTVRRRRPPPVAAAVTNAWVAPGRVLADASAVRGAEPERPRTSVAREVPGGLAIVAAKRGAYACRSPLTEYPVLDLGSGDDTRQADSETAAVEPDPDEGGRSTGCSFLARPRSQALGGPAGALAAEIVAKGTPEHARAFIDVAGSSVG